MENSNQHHSATITIPMKASGDTNISGKCKVEQNLPMMILSLEIHSSVAIVTSAERLRCPDVQEHY